MRIGEAFRQIRKDKEVTQEQLGASLGVSKASISQYERGERNFNAATILRWCKALGVTENEVRAIAGQKIDKARPIGGIPVLNLAPAGNVLPYDVTDDSETTGIGEIEWGTIDADTHARAIIVVGDSMEPNIKAGDYLVFAPIINGWPKLDDGKVVLVRFSEESPHDGWTIARFYRTPRSSMAKLHKDNHRYPGIDVDMDSDHIARMSVLIQLRRDKV